MKVFFPWNLKRLSVRAANHTTYVSARSVTLMSSPTENFDWNKTWWLMKANSWSDMSHWTNNEIEAAVESWLWLRVELMAWKLSWLERLNRIQWSWVQTPLRPTFYSYFREYIYIYIYIRSICRQQLFRSLRAHQYSSDQKKILKDQSAQTTARVVYIYISLEMT